MVTRLPRYTCQFSVGVVFQARSAASRSRYHQSGPVIEVTRLYPQCRSQDVVEISQIWDKYQRDLHVGTITMVSHLLLLTSLSRSYHQGRGKHLRHPRNKVLCEDILFLHLVDPHDRWWQVDVGVDPHWTPASLIILTKPYSQATDLRAINVMSQFGIIIHTIPELLCQA